MRRLLIAATALSAAALPLPALAQDAAAPASAPAPSEPEMKAMAKAMKDPARQHEMALLLRAMSEVMLDMPVAPMVDAMEQATGEKGPDVKPGATVRSMSPDAASRVPGMIEKGVPAAMSAMGGMANGAAELTPAMKEMAARMAPMLKAMAEKMEAAMPAPAAKGD